MNNLIDIHLLKQILECAMLTAGQPVSLERFLQLFEDVPKITRTEIQTALNQLSQECQTRGLLLKETAGGFCLQITPALTVWIQKLFEKRPPRYSRALLETLALIAYRQPLTRAEIEDVRGVSVSSNIFKILTEREWIQILGYKDVPGKPALYATTKKFLDYFNLKTLNDLPPLAEISAENLEITEKIDHVLKT